MPKVIALATLIVCSFPSCLQAHEYWLEPVASIVKMGNEALINIKNGENYSGPTYPYKPGRVKSVSITNEHDTQPYNGRLGDYPAISPELSSLGIHCIAIETNAQLLTYSSWKKFTAFLEYHGFTNTVDRHMERNLPTIDVTENYTRSAKAFVRVKASTSQSNVATDSSSAEHHNALTPVGHEFEMILLESPFGQTSTVELQLLFKGKPLGNRQTEMFWKGDKTVRITAITNKDGVASFELPGEGKYLLNAVHLTEARNKEAHWASHWASITFER